MLATKELLNSNNVTSPDLVLAGYNGDINEDSITAIFLDSLDLKRVTSPYKQYCGEYGTSSAFALWMAAHILKAGVIPDSFNLKVEKTTGIKNILIYNHLGNTHHSIVLVSAC
ncbi:MAG: hypothetical protein IPP71_18675 [Bacteroidetes bacterium]|nr:hypothetical protein [Bacteroidota bacterium]